LPADLSSEELLRTTKLSWQACLADFYKDDWARLNDHLVRLADLSARWKAQPAPMGAEEAFRENSAGFASAVDELRTAVEAKSEEGVTSAMRAVGKRIASFETFR
jgi:cytochrome c556